MLWFKDGDRNTAFFSMLWSKGEIIIVGFIVYGLIIRILMILTKLIEDHILDFYKNLYVESISNVLDTNNMLGTLFIATHLGLCS